MTPREWLGRAKTAQQELRLIREAREAIVIISVLNSRSSTLKSL